MKKHAGIAISGHLDGLKCQKNSGGGSKYRKSFSRKNGIFQDNNYESKIHSQGVCQVREVREKSGNSICLKKSQGKVREFYLFEKSQGNVRENACPCMHLRKFNGIFSENLKCI